MTNKKPPTKAELSEKKVLNLTELAIYVDIPKRSLHRMIKENRFACDHIKGTKPKKWSTVVVDKWLSGEV